MAREQEPPVGGTIVWASAVSLAKAKAVVLAVALALAVVAVEAVRLAVATALGAVAPKAFGVLAARSLSGPEIPAVIAVALGGLAYVAYRVARIFVEGMPAAIGLHQGADGRPAALEIAWDGLAKPRRRFDFGLIGEIDAIGRGTMGGGGHHVRMRVAGRRLALTVARLETSAEADALARRLIGYREQAAAGSDRAAD